MPKVKNNHFFKKETTVYIDFIKQNVYILKEITNYE